MDRRYAANPGNADRRRDRAGRASDGTRTIRAALLVGCIAMLSACATGEGGFPGVSFSDPRQNMTNDDRRIAALAMQIAMERRQDHEASTWTNGLSGNHGAVVPRRSYRSQSGDFCRRFDETMTVSGVTATFERTACRGGDGSWTALT